MLLSLFRCTHALFVCVSFFFFFWCCFVFVSLCPNMCSAFLFSLAIHCLTAEVFFQPFKSCTLKFPAKDYQVCILLSLPALSLCTLSSSPGCLAATPLGLSLLHTMNHRLSQSQIYYMYSERELMKWGNTTFSYCLFLWPFRCETFTILKCVIYWSVNKLIPQLSLIYLLYNYKRTLNKRSKIESAVPFAFKSPQLLLLIAVQVIVMSGHETIRVLEVEVDASLPSSVPDGKSEGKAEEGVAGPAGQPEAGSTQDGPTVPQSAGGVSESWSY